MTPFEATCGVFAHYLQIVPVIQSGQEVLGHLAVEFAFLVETAGLAVDVRLVVQHRVVSTQVTHLDLWLLGLIFSFLGTFFSRHGVSFNLRPFLSFPSSFLLFVFLCRFFLLFVLGGACFLMSRQLIKQIMQSPFVWFFFF